jgi:hypothetical protein
MTLVQPLQPLPPHTQVPTANNTQERGDFAIRGLFECGIDAIIDARIANTAPPTDPRIQRKYSNNKRKPKDKNIKTLARLIENHSTPL